MEYPFKDLLPREEATARTGYYKDWTHIDADTFHQISELVKFIREKGYGADTREAIAQALERVYHDALQSGNANMEVSMARGNFSDLAERLNHFAKTFSDGSPSIFYDTLAELKSAYPNGAEGVALIRETDPAKIYVWNGLAWEDFGDYQGIEVKDGSITPAKTDFLVRNKNLAKLDDGIETKNGITLSIKDDVIHIDGTTTAGGWFMLTDFKEILEENTEYSLSLYGYQTSGIGIQSDSGASIKSGQGTFVATDVGSSQRIRIYIGPNLTFRSTEVKVQIEEGSEATDWIKPSYEIKKELISSDFKELISSEFKDIEDKTKYIYETRNLVKAEEGTTTSRGLEVSIDSDQQITLDGRTTASGWYDLTAYESVVETGKTYTLSKFGMSTGGLRLFDSTGATLISGETTQIIEGEVTQQKVQIYLQSGLTFRDTKFKIQLEEGSVKTDWVRSGFSIQPELYSFDLATRRNDLLSSDNIELLLPDEMYFIDEEPLRVYKTSLSFDDTNRFSYDLAIYSEGDELPYFDQQREKVELNSLDINDEFGVYLSDSDIKVTTGKSVRKVSKSVNDISNKNPVILMFGDSTTEGGLATRTKESLDKYVTSNFIGTRNDIHGTPSEGRSGWCISNYVGYRTLTGDLSLPLENFPSFLKVATNSDKTNNPNLCFTRTFSAKEETYSEAVDKNQEFYIFDFEHYLTVNSFDVPDVVVINMSTNDFNAYRGEADGGVSIVKWSAEVMMSQIHKVAPDCKILIIPTPVKRDSYYSRALTSWAKECLSLSRAHNHVDTVFQFIHQNKEFNFNFIERSTPERIDNSYTVSDITHTNIGGYKEGAKPIAFYILNQL